MVNDKNKIESKSHEIEMITSYHSNDVSISSKNVLAVHNQISEEMLREMIQLLVKKGMIIIFIYSVYIILHVYITGYIIFFEVSQAILLILGTL